MSNNRGWTRREWVSRAGWASLGASLPLLPACQWGGTRGPVPTPPLSEGEQANDPNQWLESIDDPAALRWAHQQTAQTRQTLSAWPEFERTRDMVRRLMDDPRRIPSYSRIGRHVYDFWTDEQHPRGLWRRMPITALGQGAPRWETLLDLDALSQREGEPWAFGGATILRPTNDRCMIELSKAGTDATVWREFDLTRRQWVRQGFELPSSKSAMEWLDRDTLLVLDASTLGSQTQAGYGGVVRRWRRGQALSDAPAIWKAGVGDTAVGFALQRSSHGSLILLLRKLDFYRVQRAFYREGQPPLPLDVPDDAEVVLDGERLHVVLRSDWQVAGQTWKAGSLLVTELNPKTLQIGPFQALFQPEARSALTSWTTTQHHVVLHVLTDVRSHLQVGRQLRGQWHMETHALAPGLTVTDITGLHDPWEPHDPYAEVLWVRTAGYLTPDTLSLADLRQKHPFDAALRPVHQLPASFDAAGMQVSQSFARSADGTSVPYFVVRPKAVPGDVTLPTLLTGYGGFQMSQLPSYLRLMGPTWLDRGGAFVVANIRGGGEYGPAWHQAAVRRHRQRGFDDFIAVAEDLVAKGLTRPRQLGISGGSNGGLLVAAVMLQRPELFRAVYCEVPLTDMLRYTQLLVGPSWVAEYGDPADPEERAALAKYSPYQNTRAEGVYPRVLVRSSVTDDRVHPGHARKWVAKLQSQGHEALYIETEEGGHQGRGTAQQGAELYALKTAYLWEQLG